MRHWRWLDVVKDSDCDRDSISPKEGQCCGWRFSTPIKDLFLRMIVVSPLIYMIKKAQVQGLKKENWNEEWIRWLIPLFVGDNRGFWTQCGRVSVPTTGGDRQTVLEDAHKSIFLIHPGATNMYSDMKLNYWWPFMKREIASLHSSP